MSTQNFLRQIPKNLFVNLLSFTSTVLIGLWLTPYLLKYLGIVAYGLIPLAMFFSQYVSVIINAINMSINRFLLIALQKHDDKMANEVFNTALIILLVFILLQSIVMIWILFNLNTFFTIPPDLFTDALWLFGLTFAGFSVSLLRSVFGTSMFAYNRLDILRMIDIVQNIVRLIVIVLLFSYDAPSLKYVGIANFIAALSAVVSTLYYFKQYTPQLLVNFHSFSKKRVSELSQMSVWILVNQVGVLLLGNIDLYLVNKWLGAKATGEYAIVLQFTSIFKIFLSLLAGVLTPVIMTYYANGEYKKLKEALLLATKLLIIILIPLLVMIIGFTKNIIMLWLGSQYVYMNTIVSFSLFFFVFAIPMSTLFNITFAYNKVKLPALISIFLGFISIMGIYWMITQLQMELWSVVAMKLVIEVIFVLFFVIYISKILEMNISKLLLIFLNSLCLFLFLFFLVSVIKSYFLLNSWMMVIGLCFGLCIIIYPSIFMIILSRKERNILYKNYFS